jgi:hypothetical protein
MNENASFLLFVLVSVGAVPEGHSMEAPHVTLRAVPSAVKISVKPIARLAVAGVFDIVNVVIAAFSDTVNICAALKSRVRVPPEIVGLLVGSL